MLACRPSMNPPGRVLRRVRRRSTCTRSRRPYSGRGRRRTSARTCFCASMMPEAGRAFLRRLTPHVDSAAGWWSATNPWIAVGISYAGLKALGLPEDSLQSFPEAFREGMAARARQLGDVGLNDPKNWDSAFGKGEVHIGLSAFSDSEESRRRILGYRSRAVRGLLRRQRFGHAGFRRAARRPQFTGLQRRYRPTRDRGQWRRPAARAGTADQGRGVHPWISR